MGPVVCAADVSEDRVQKCRNVSPSHSFLLLPRVRWFRLIFSVLSETKRNGVCASAVIEWSGEKTHFFGSILLGSLWPPPISRRSPCSSPLCSFAAFFPRNNHLPVLTYPFLFPSCPFFSFYCPPFLSFLFLPFMISCQSMHSSGLRFLSMILPCFTLTLYRKSNLCLPGKGIALPQSQFLHTCVCERFIYSQERSTYLAAAK